jgi:hypothetical protein
VLLVAYVDLSFCISFRLKKGLQRLIWCVLYFSVLILVNDSM